ncbi:hypothetical protein BDK51DRAFT_27024 [Blyttiomyces helicus]|uniref:Uncharacterized protein n=1 Tax=Blyttiomyces helicus TaxID=388810 RepID=A0A4P9VVU7_9FUNG|nr:hypothetical protein BDK51DRAFT_27024 [Blyttiomyces helicus]|eukprot:RKO82965.1 hypothetical protein BDK51DRAFT_27024 [Blyttiomyces helicus]
MKLFPARNIFLSLSVGRRGIERIVFPSMEQFEPDGRWLWGVGAPSFESRVGCGPPMMAGAGSRSNLCTTATIANPLPRKDIPPSTGQPGHLAMGDFWSNFKVSGGEAQEVKKEPDRAGEYKERSEPPSRRRKRKVQAKIGMFCPPLAGPGMGGKGGGGWMWEFLTGGKGES